MGTLPKQELRIVGATAFSIKASKLKEGAPMLRFLTTYIKTVISRLSTKFLNPKTNSNSTMLDCS